jgi:hypothetical protein
VLSPTLQLASSSTGAAYRRQVMHGRSKDVFGVIRSQSRLVERARNEGSRRKLLQPPILCFKCLLELDRRHLSFAFLLQGVVELIQLFLVGRLERAMALPEVRRLRFLILPVLEECSRWLTRIGIMWQGNKLPVHRHCLVQALEREHSRRIVHDDRLHIAPVAPEGDEVTFLCFRSMFDYTLLITISQLNAFGEACAPRADVGKVEALRIPRW